jgi:hypothetical protein
MRVTSQYFHDNHHNHNHDHDHSPPPHSVTPTCILTSITTTTMPPTMDGCQTHANDPVLKCLDNDPNRNHILELNMCWRLRLLRTIHGIMFPIFRRRPKQPTKRRMILSLTRRRQSSTQVLVDRSSSSSNNSPGGKITRQTNDEDHNVVPKCVMQILEARIIDPTTLRDMHVGLPAGSFGFVFLARPSCLGTTMESTPTRDYLCAVSTLEEAQSWVVRTR